MALLMRVWGGCDLCPREIVEHIPLQPLPPSTNHCQEVASLEVKELRAWNLRRAGRGLFARESACSAAALD